MSSSRVFLIFILTANILSGCEIEWEEGVEMGLVTGALLEERRKQSLVETKRSVKYTHGIATPRISAAMLRNVTQCYATMSVMHVHYKRSGWTQKRIHPCGFEKQTDLGYSTNTGAV